MAQFIPIDSRLRNMGFNFVAGIDEAGRGPLAGPVVSAVVILKADSKISGIDDSKKISAKKRVAVFNEILENCIDYAIAVVPHSTIDKINILNSTRLAHKTALQALKKKPELILIDGNDKQYIEKSFVNIIKGDSRVKCIAAASILAKVARDKIMEYYGRIYPEYGFSKHAGYGTREHRKNIFKHGLCEIHRKSYTIKEL